LACSTTSVLPAASVVFCVTFSVTAPVVLSVTTVLACSTVSVLPAASVVFCVVVSVTAPVAASVFFVVAVSTFVVVPSAFVVVATLSVVTAPVLSVLTVVSVFVLEPSVFVTVEVSVFAVPLSVEAEPPELPPEELPPEPESSAAKFALYSALTKTPPAFFAGVNAAAVETTAPLLSVQFTKWQPVLAVAVEPAAVPFAAARLSDAALTVPLAVSAET